MVEEWGLLGLCAICFISATIIPFPSEAAFIYCLHQGQPVYLVFLCAIVFNSLGGATNYALGVWGRKLSKKEHVKAEKLVQRFGSYTALFSWVPFIGDPLLIALGVYRCAVIPTMLFMVIGKSLRYLACYYGFISLA